MSLSNLSAAFGQSTGAQQNGRKFQNKREGAEQALAVPAKDGEVEVQTLPYTIDLDGNKAERVQTMPYQVYPGAGNTDREIDKEPYQHPSIDTVNLPGSGSHVVWPLTPIQVDQDPGMKDKMLAELQKDVNFSYDEETKTMTISGGEMDQHTMDALRAYMDLSDGEFDDANIIIGQDVTFGNSIEKGLHGKYSVTGPVFGDIKCKSIDIQSQNITNADRMFAETQADIIKVADQPNLESADSMFSNSNAKMISIGEFPDSIKDSAATFIHCYAVVMNKEGTEILHDGSSNRPIIEDVAVYPRDIEDLIKSRTAQAEDALGVTVEDEQESTSFYEAGLGE